MVDNGMSKNQGQRKRRQERESCINNVKLNLNLTSNDYNNRHVRSTTIDNHTYTKRKPSTNKFQRGSLENVSSNPWGELHIEEQSSLRRSRSLAISREDIFTNVDVIPTTGHSGGKQQRRSQLIPRAKLIDRTASRDQRYVTQGISLENLQTSERAQQIIKRKPSLTTTPPDYSPPRSDRNLIKNRKSNHHDYDTVANEYKKPKFIITNDNNNLDSNYYSNKSSINSIDRGVSYEDLSGLSLPNYYPDSKYDSTDNTDNISLTDDISTESCDNNNLSKNKYSSCDNISTITTKWTLKENESISYDENIILSTNRPLYDSIKDSHYAKPRTIRGPTPYNKESDIYLKENRRRSKHYSSTSSLENKQPSTNNINNKENKKEVDNPIIYETDTNFDEINLNNENIIKTIVEQTSKTNTISNYSNIETNPLYEQIEEYQEIKINELNKQENNEVKIINENSNDETNKTIIEIESATTKETQLVVEEQEKYEEFKTIVKVDDNSSVKVEEDCEEKDKNKTTKENNKQHSHNYLKEFLETQKGSRKPLQNFLTKKITNLSRKTSKEFHSTTTNLVDNQFYSLPDITATKNLRKCEKIDRKLRKCEKSNNLVNNNRNYESNQSRFIVNIGKHFDITANTNIPLDFEVKIAKVPKKNKGSKKNSHVQKTKIKNDAEFLEAVKDLKETLHANLDLNQNITKPEIIAIKTKEITTPSCIIITESNENDIIMDDRNECTKEYQEKLGTMRNYWDKMLNNNNNKTETNPENDEKSTKCKIVNVQTKVEDVKKKFELIEEKEPEKQINKVQLVKQIFEPKTIKEKSEKLSPLIKETCYYFENPFNHHQKDNSNQFESLNPNIVEIIDKDTLNEEIEEKYVKKPISKPRKNDNKKTHKLISKSKSVAYPEFDHVRYRVVKSDLFQKNIFANCEKESQFDGLMQYLQDYSFQELLIDNNIVIIEPIRTNIHHNDKKNSNKIIASRNITPYIHKTNGRDDDDDNNSKLRRHFFYHPIRVNKEVNDDELPNPDTVKQVRQFFEGGLLRSRSSQEIEFENIREKCHNSNTNNKNTDPDKDRCSVATDSNSNPSNISSDFDDSQENLFDSLTDEHCCEQQYVSEDILEKIREYGTTVTYYGGRVLKKQCPPSLTKVIMEEIKNNEKRTIECNCSNKKITSHEDGNNKESYQGIKFKLVKSNSCNSRLELVGTNNLKDSKKKYLTKQKELIKQHNLINNNNLCIEEVKNETDLQEFVDNDDNNKNVDKNLINENIKQNNSKQPKIISEEKKMIQWGEMKQNEKTYNGINYNEKLPHKINHDYHNYDKVKTKINKTITDMEFEPYEVA